MRTDRYRVGFVYTVEHRNAAGRLVEPVEIVKNLIPDDGIEYMLNVAYRATPAAYSSWYLGLYTASRTPVAADTMTTLLADCVESAAYGSASRDAVTFPAAASGALTTAAAPNEFTFASAATITGGLLTTGATIGNSSGLLVSAVLFTSPKVMEIGDTLKVPIGIALTAV